MISDGEGVLEVFRQTANEERAPEKDNDWRRPYTEFIKPGASMDLRRFRTEQKNILLSCPKTPRLHARSRLYKFGVW